LTLSIDGKSRQRLPGRPPNHGVGDELQHVENERTAESLRALVQELYAHCRNYTQAHNAVAAWQLLTTAIPFVALLVAMYLLAPYHYLWTLLLAVPAGSLLTRFFALQHDCGHGSFFSSRKANEITGQIISMLTFTPYDHWRRSHAIHHAGSGNLERRGIGDIDTMTVREYQKSTRAEQWRYRLMRHPLVALVFGPPLYFMVLQRFAMGSPLRNAQVLLAVLLHNLALFLFYGTLCYLLGTFAVLLIVLSVTLVAAWIGGWLFFVQHQFEETLWEGADDWDVKLAALKGSSHLVLNPVLNWLTCDIGLHHIHHLSSRIPNYRLRACMAAHKDLQEIAPKLTLRRAMASMHLSLWDETSRKLISFADHARLTKTA
jgi:acyl-lipid omega-6 desaturase (Delta-12 desaturase)